MTENNEFERHNLAIDRDMEVDCDIGQEIAVYIETWFDVDQKFGTNIADEDGTWLNMYGKYNPFVDTLRIECEISRDNGSEYFDYEPTASESRLIKDMIAEKIREEYRQTPQEFCDALNNTGESVYVYNNISSLKTGQKQPLNELALDLAPGEYGRAVCNGRFRDWDTGIWYYVLDILNVIPLAEPTDSLTSFTDREPNKIYTQIDRLW